MHDTFGAHLPSGRSWVRHSVDATRPRNWSNTHRQGRSIRYSALYFPELELDDMIPGDLLPARTAAIPLDVAHDITQAAIHAGQLFDRDFLAPRGHGISSARSVLDDIWNTTMQDLSFSPARDDPARLSVLAGMLDTVRDLEKRVLETPSDDGRALLRALRMAFQELHSASTVDQLFEAAAEQLCAIGLFDRALVSTVDGSYWGLHTMVIENDPGLAAEMVAAGRESPPLLDSSLVESDIIEQGKAGLVFDVQNNPRVNRTLVSMSGCTSYSVAPIRIAGRVQGLVHADAYRDKRPVDETDRAVLNLFAEGLAHALGRATVIDKLTALTGTLMDVTASTAAPPRDTNEYGLSKRELEVIERMASGESNRLIAQRLSISEGTVKTHISHILRKLDAANRAEAVAFWLRRA